MLGWRRGKNTQRITISNDEAYTIRPGDSIKVGRRWCKVKSVDSSCTFTVEDSFKLWLYAAELKLFANLFIAQAVSYCVIVVNWRAISQANVAQALLSDGLYASLNYFILRKLIKDESKFVGWLGYLLGSLLGSYLGILLSKELLGK